MACTTASNSWLMTCVCCRWLNTFEAKLLREPVANLTDVLDVPAAINYFIITEITKNPGD